ncbi:50S ribosomal protein L13 [Candidatus Woesearchaeota archaeon]|nr:50S ribosomal protein L13 [Candidatus Woesearchaeota archaeon]
MIIIDGTNLLLGRIASFAAKKALLGKTIRVINSEKIYISGKKENILEQYKIKRERGTHTTGPFFPRYPDQIVKRTIRGMLPYKKGRGKAAFKRVRCYIGVPKEFEKHKKITIKDANISKLPNLQYLDLKTLSKNLGAKIE